MDENNKEILTWNKATDWARNNYFDEVSRQEIQNLLDHNEKKEIYERFYKDLEFGTGGLRSIIGMGSNRINKYTVRKATQALGQIINRHYSDHSVEKKKVIVSYDSRQFSFEFAKEACSVLAANGLSPQLFKVLTPVPLLSYAIRKTGAHAGIMITASHNPKQYNGLKAYWSDGAQVIPPIDREIITAYNSITDFSTIRYIPFEEALAKNQIAWTSSEIDESYYKLILENSLRPELCRQWGEQLKVVYTPIHGTGLIPCTRVLKDLNLNSFFVVNEQSDTSSNFSTVELPNPEDPRALKLAVDLMTSKNADIAFGTDPDTDRLGVVVTHQQELHYLNGNQISVLLLYYILQGLKESGKLPPHPYAIKTFVSTELTAVICQHYGVQLENTLTGFKWICGRMKEIEEQEPHRNFIFASEESFGFLVHDQARDKDAVSAMARMSEAALWYKMKNMTLVDALDEIYQKFGFFLETLLSLDYCGTEGAEKIARIMNFFRHYPNDEIHNEKIIALEDFQIGQKTEFLQNESTLKTTKQQTPLHYPQSDVLGFTFRSGNKLYLRPSGTEPKIKFYFMIQVQEGNLQQKKESAHHKAKEMDSILRGLSENI